MTRKSTRKTKSTNFLKYDHLMIKDKVKKSRTKKNNKIRSKLAMRLRRARLKQEQLKLVTRRTRKTKRGA